jgi:hypothetical protein
MHGTIHVTLPAAEIFALRVVMGIMKKLLLETSVNL